MNDRAGEVWTRMRELVLEQHDRRRAVSDALGMSFVRVKALRRVVRHPLTMRELTGHLATDRPYTTLIVDDLERRGLVTRTPHPEDRRCKVVTATEAGAAAAETANRILDEPPEALRALDPNDLAALEKILSALSGLEAPGFAVDGDADSR
jgi:DNA-binding MarR family transcriptional regulator